MDADIKGAVAARLEPAEGVIEWRVAAVTGLLLVAAWGADVGRAQFGGHNCRISELLIMEEWSSNTKGLSRLLA
ncbi:MAG TPA: hypothetical protein EYG11_11405 [Candidatus Latescibacteria bacterium]|nr:hypothetical protein [Candidatus Handelsmanbacteria bacterium]HIL09302.1 hypothetical protein [Candidatus Latescibacterota bacterium]